MARKSPSVKRCVVRLDPEKRERLEAMLRKGKHRAQAMTKARILLLADVCRKPARPQRLADHRGAPNQSGDRSSDAQAARRRVRRVLTREERVRPSVAKIFDGAAEAWLIALACSQPPEGHARWSLRLLESKVVELGIWEGQESCVRGRLSIRL
jgi:hypothetical protein